MEQAKQRVKECTVADVQARMMRGEKFHFIDVRKDHEFWIDHAAGACHLGKGIIERDIENVIPDKQAVIVLYCGGGYRIRCWRRIYCNIWAIPMWHGCKEVLKLYVMLVFRLKKINPSRNDATVLNIAQSILCKISMFFFTRDR